MHVKRLLILLVGLFALRALPAQDIHFTQYNMSPMTLNPANIGGFQGTIRIGGIYREQWRSVIGSSRYTTPSAWVDAPIMRGFRRQDWIGVGFMLFQDKSGIGGLSNGTAKLGAAYHFALDKKGNTHLTLGAHYGGGQRKIDRERLEFEDGIIASGGSGDKYNKSLSADYQGVVADANFTDIDAGITLTSKLSKTSDLVLGVAMYHITRPSYSLLGGGGASTGGNSTTSDLPSRLVVHGQFNTALNKKLTFNPTFLFQSHVGLNEIVLQAPFGYRLDPKKDIILHAGPSFRVVDRDAASILLGMTKGNLRVGLAYDVNLSSLNVVSNYRGGWEIAANYIFKVYKPAVIKPKVLCPRY